MASCPRSRSPTCVERASLFALAAEVHGPQIAGFHQLGKLAERMELREVELFRHELRQRRNGRLLVAEHFLPRMSLDGRAGQLGDFDDLFTLTFRHVVLAPAALRAAHGVELQAFLHGEGAGEDAEQIDLRTAVGFDRGCRSLKTTRLDLQRRPPPVSSRAGRSAWRRIAGRGPAVAARAGRGPRRRSRRTSWPACRRFCPRDEDAASVSPGRVPGRVGPASTAGPAGPAVG